MTDPSTTQAKALEKFPRVELLFPSKYLRAADLRGEPRTVTIAGLEPRHELRAKDGTIEKRPVLHFEGIRQMLVLNKTNALSIAALHGPELSGWIGKRVVLYPDKVAAFGAVTDAIRVRGVDAGIRKEAR